MFSTLEEWVEKYLLNLYRRSVDGTAMTWCREWWRHPEAYLRLDALWRAWEYLRQQPATGMAVWMRDYCDPHMAVLLSESGPFKGCEPMRHSPYELRALPDARADRLGDVDRGVRGVALAGVGGRRAVRPSYVIAAAASPFVAMFGILFGLILLGGSASDSLAGACSTVGPSADGQPPLVQYYIAAAAAYRLGPVGYAYLAAINKVETEFGTDLAVSSAGAVGWMQFEPGTFAQYGVSVTNPNAPADPDGSPGRDLHRGAVPARERRAGRLAGGDLRLQPRRLVRGRGRRRWRCATAASTGLANLNAGHQRCVGRPPAADDAGADHGRT